MSPLTIYLRSANWQASSGTTMKNQAKLFYICVLFLAAFELGAQTMDSNLISLEAEKFLKQQTQAIQDSHRKVEITVGQLDPRLKLQACEQLIPFLTPGSKAWGKITLGMQCSSPKPWKVYLAANIKVFGDYFVTNRAVSLGQVITEQDLTKLQGEISSQPAGIITDPIQAIGKTMLASYAAGVSLRKDMFKIIPVIQQGQTIKVSSSGAGFTVSNEAVALNNAGEGQVAKAKTVNGQVISGIAKIGGIIEVN
jgi:flagella basal body P-ring formation protein FlgA